ncbi:MAG: hypothetical protein HY930_04415 [Euryarchaeota archaeon]|nr:hypothetical protein [Euryarchaeota archaeon]
MPPVDFSKENHDAAQFVKDLFPKFFKILEVREGYKRKGADKHIYYKGRLVAYAELEAKLVWKTVEWNKDWHHVQFAERKGRFAETDVPTFMIMFNKDGSNGLIVDAKTMVSSPCPRVWTRRGAEHFYQVPIEKVVFGPENFEKFILDKLHLKPSNSTESAK